MKLKLFLFLFIFIFYFNSNAQVTADFTANTTSGCPNPLLVIITDNSTGGVNQYSWTLTGPTGFSPLPGNTNQISASLSLPGFYTVVLTVCNTNTGDCDTKTETNYIEVFEEPSYTYTINPTKGCAPLQVCFDIDITPGCGTTTSSLFDANDGVVYPVDSFCHTYTTSGNYYNFTFSTQNSCGCVTTETISDTIEIINKPIANFIANQTFSCIPPLDVVFTNTSIASSSATYQWYIDGIQNNTTTNLLHSFNVGNYDIQLIASESNLCADTIAFANMISVGNPIADFSSDTNEICAGSSIQFTDLSNGNPISWYWEVIGTSMTSSIQNPIFTFPNNGIYSIKLKTSYAGGCADSLITNNMITVNENPINSFTLTDSTSCLLPFTTTFTSTSTNSINTTWSFPGGTPATFSGMGPVNVTYNAFGNYNITLIDTSINECFTQTIFNNKINLTQLMANILVDTSNGCLPITSNLSVNTNNVDSIVSWSWTLPGSDIGSSTLSEPTAVYVTNDCFDVSVDIVSNLGCAVSVTDSNLICAGIPPINDFTFTPISTCFEVDDICFTFTGSGADTLLWNFDDGPLMWTGPNGSPCHSYNSDIGNYTPTLIAYNYGCPSDTLTFIDSIHILGPVAVFTAAFESCENWNTFIFTNASVEADSSYWVFGDASVGIGMDTSTQENPTWTYPTTQANISYSITLVVYNDSTGCDHTVTHTINVFPHFANFTATPSIGCAPLDVAFQNTSFNTGSNANNTNWNWDSTYYFGSDPLTLGSVWNNSASLNKIYTVPGIYDVIMRNTDSRGCVDTITYPNLITVHGIIGGFTSDTTEGCLPLTINFTDTSAAPLTYINSWHWDFGTGNLNDTSNVQNPSFTYNSGGFYDVSLTVTDSFGCARTFLYNNFIDAHEPFANFSLSDTFICNNQSVSITNSSFGNSLSYDWQFQNASPSNYNTDGNPPIISYITEGNHTLYLEITDNLGCTDDTTIVLPVFDVVAEAIASQDYAPCSNPPLLVNFTNTSYNNIDSSSVFWDFGNGSSSTGFNPSALYSTPGEFIVTLQISSLSGCSDTINVDTLLIEGPWGVFENISQFNSCVCDSMTFAITTLNATTPTFLTGDGQAIPFSPIGLLGDTIFDTLTIQYCTLGDFLPSLSFTEGVCSFNVPAAITDSIHIDSLVANFTYPNTSNCDSATICFTDLSYNELNGTGNIFSWTWDFGDGSASNIQNPCHLFSTPGKYNVCLSVLDSFTCTQTFCDTLIIRELPNINFGIGDSSVCENNSFTFYDSTTFNFGSVLDSIFWNFGTGNSNDTSTYQNPTFTYNTSGTYTVSLEVFDNFGCFASDSDQVVIYSTPTIVASQDTTLCLGDSAQILATGAIDYTWFPNSFLNNNQINNPISFSNTDIEYYVIGIDSNGCSSTDTLNIFINSVVSDFNFSTACLAYDISFTNSSSSILGTVNTWSWNFDDISSGVNNISNIENPNHLFNNIGSYDISLMITDNLGCTDIDTQMINILDKPVAVLVASDIDICVGDVVILDASNSSFSTSSIQYFWDENYNTGIDNNSINYTIYPSSDVQVMLALQDDNGCVDTAFQNIVAHPLPIANFTTSDACVGFPINLNSTSTSVDGFITTYNWDLNNSLNLNGENTTYIPNNTDDLSITLIIEDANNCIDTSNTITIFVDTINTATLSLNDTILCLPTNLIVDVEGNADHFSWQPTNIVDNTNSASVIANIENTSTLIVTAYSEHDFCPQVSDSATIVIIPKPTIQYTVNPNPVFLGLTADINLEILPFNSNDSVVWENNPDINTFIGTEIEATPTEETYYNFSLIYYYDSVKCVIDSFVNIQVLDECNNELVYAPNVFTPNNDNKNDFFNISGVSIDHLNFLRIFDRWGALIYQVENVALKNGKMDKINMWNGKDSKGQFLNNGVYVFSYEIVCLNNDIVKGSGNITLIR